MQQTESVGASFVRPIGRTALLCKPVRIGTGRIPGLGFPQTPTTVENLLWQQRETGGSLLGAGPEIAFNRAGKDS
jgi:hypothetical protein